MCIRDSSPTAVVVVEAAPASASPPEVATAGNEVAAVTAASAGQLPVLMSPVQMQLQAQLRMKHNELSKRLGEFHNWQEIMYE